MRKSVLTITAAATLGFGGLFSGGAVQADTIESLKDQKTDIQNERESIKDNLSDAEAEVADVMIDIEALNEDIKQNKEAKEANEEKINDTENKIDKTNDKVDRLNEEIDELEEKIQKRMDILHERATTLQEEGGDVSYMDVILGAKSFGDFISRMGIVHKITESDAELVKEQEADKAKLDDKQAKVENELEDLKGLKTELKDAEDTIEAQLEANAEKKEDLKAKKNNLKELASELEMKESQMASLESDVSQSLESAREERQNELTTLSSSDDNNSTSGDNNNSPSDANSNSTSSDNANSGSKKKSTSDNTVSTKPSNASGGVASAINLGKQFIGNSSYVLGAKNPAAGQFDCSGFVSWSLENGSGYSSVPRSTRGLRSFGTKVPASDMQAGDLVFFDTNRTDGHVGIYMGGGKFIGSQSSSGVSIESMNSNYWSNHFSGHVRRIQ